MEQVRRFFSLASPGRRELAGVAASLVLLPALMGVAAAQPIVVQRHTLGQRLDVQAFFVFDTSLSMSARTGKGPTRLERAKREAEGVARKIGDIPVGVATMTDRVLPELMPTPNSTLIQRTIEESVGINRPPPSKFYPGRATNFAALYPLANANFYSPGVRHRILVVFTDGEATPIHSAVGYQLASAMAVSPLFVHVWAATDRVYLHGRIDPRYTPDLASGTALSRFAAATHGRVFEEDGLQSLARTIRDEADGSPVGTAVLGYARVALAPWFVLAGIVPLGFLLYRRNL